jgi:hypothetical protein
MDVSKIVLNRGLRQAVLAAAAAQGLSMSEIAVRCGRVKHDSKGKESGETSWLARRLCPRSSAGRSGCDGLPIKRPLLDVSIGEDSMQSAVDRL